MAGAGGGWAGGTAAGRRAERGGGGWMELEGVKEDWRGEVEGGWRGG